MPSEQKKNRMLNRKSLVTSESSNGQKFSDAERESHLRINSDFYSCLEIISARKAFKEK